MKNSTSKCPLHPNTILSSYCSKCGIIMCPNCSLDHKHSQVSRIPKSFAEKYDFKKYLGAGCSGKVFSCTSYFDSNEYALKLIEIDSDDKLTVFEAQKEIEILQKINHQNIIRYYDNEYLEEDETFGILMELGESNLMDVIKSIDQKQAFSYFRQICSAVEYIHINLGILHRDLKLANILIKNKQVKVCDFGAAKKLSPNETKSITAFIGTPEYLAPELLTSSSGKFTEASDVWALGIIFHKILTNNLHPFLPKNEESNTNRDINVNKIMENMNKNKIQLHETITNPLYLNILKECLQLDPKKRPSLPQIKSIIIGGGIPLNSPTNLNSVSEEQTLKKVKKAVSKSSFVDFKLMHKGEKYAIYGDATSSINGEFSNEAEVRSRLLEIKPINKLNIEISSSNPNKDFQTPYLLPLLSKDLIIPSTSKALQISICPNVCLVEDSDNWRKFWWKVFYESCLEPLQYAGVKYVIQAEKDWDNSLVESQLKQVLNQMEDLGTEIDNLEHFRLNLHSYVNVSDAILNQINSLIYKLKFNMPKTIELTLSSEKGKASTFKQVFVTLDKKMSSSKDSELESLTLLSNSANNLNEILPAISVFIKRQTNLKVLKTWVGDISAEADFDEYAKAFTPKMMAGLKTLSIGFNSWKLKPFISDYNFNLLFANICAGMTNNLKDLSLWIWSCGYLEKTFNTMYDSIIMTKKFNIFDLYFEGWFDKAQDKDEWNQKIFSNLKKNNSEIDIRALHMAMYVKK